MKWRVVLVLLLMPALAVPASAGIFGKKPAPPNPADRVPELINSLKTDGDENKRAAAAEELRQYDPAAFPQVVPALIDAAQNDKKPSVRSEAIQTLGKIRPPSQAIGQALEQARDKDPSMRVRMQARSSLLWYPWPGHHAGKTAEPPIQTKEPAAEASKGTPPPSRTKPIITPTAPAVPRSPKEQSVEPPLAQPVAVTQPRQMPLPVPPPLPQPQPLPETPSTGFRPMPPGPATTTVKTTEPPLAPADPIADVNKTEVVPATSQPGPDLGPPSE